MKWGEYNPYAASRQSIIRYRKTIYMNLIMEMKEGDG
jgi:hypothetical protein